MNTEDLPETDGSSSHSAFTSTVRTKLHQQLYNFGIQHWQSSGTIENGKFFVFVFCWNIITCIYSCIYILTDTQNPRMLTLQQYYTAVRMTINLPFGDRNCVCCMCACVLGVVCVCVVYVCCVCLCVCVFGMCACTYVCVCVLFYTVVRLCMAVCFHDIQTWRDSHLVLWLSIPLGSGGDEFQLYMCGVRTLQHQSVRAGACSSHVRSWIRILHNPFQSGK